MLLRIQTGCVRDVISPLLSRRTMQSRFTDFGLIDSDFMQMPSALRRDLLHLTFLFIHSTVARREELTGVVM